MSCHVWVFSLKHISRCINPTGPPSNYPPLFSSFFFTEGGGSWLYNHISATFERVANCPPLFLRFFERRGGQLGWYIVINKSYVVSVFFFIGTMDCYHVGRLCKETLVWVKLYTLLSFQVGKTAIDLKIFSDSPTDQVVLHNVLMFIALLTCLLCQDSGIVPATDSALGHLQTMLFCLICGISCSLHEKEHFSFFYIWCRIFSFF